MVQLSLSAPTRSISGQGILLAWHQVYIDTSQVRIELDRGTLAHVNDDPSDVIPAAPLQRLIKQSSENVLTEWHS